MKNIYDVIIIGGGPCGITSGIYAIRSGLKTLILEKQNVGGQVINTYEIKNFPTYTNINGADFCTKLYQQAKYNGLEIKYEEVISVNLKEKIKTIKTTKQEYKTKTVVISSGTTPKKLGLDREDEFIGRGISFCALCDGNFYKDKIVAVVGGGDSSMEDAIYLSSICKKVYVLNRSEKLKAQVILQNTLKETNNKNKNVEVIYNAKINKIIGENSINSIEIIVKDETKNIDVDGIFLAIGSNPDTQIFKDEIELNKNGYIVVDKNNQTNIKGVFAGGDCTQKLIRQIITACSDGAICGVNTNNYIKENF